MYDKSEPNVMQVEHALRGDAIKKRNHVGCGKDIETIANKYIDKEKQPEFLDDLLRLILAPYPSQGIKGACELIEYALCGHFNKSNKDRFYNSADAIKVFIQRYIGCDTSSHIDVFKKQNSFIEDLCEIINSDEQ